MKAITLSTITFLLLTTLNACSGGGASSSPSVNIQNNEVVKSQKIKLISSNEGLLPIEIKNDTKIATDDHVYIIAIAKTDEKTPRQCLIDFKTGICSIVTSNNDVAKLSNTKLSDLEKDGNGNRIFHAAHVQSGRIYFSINQPLSLYFDKNTDTIPDPDGFKTRDPNYYTLYDKVEFSFVSAGVWFNPTAVDFFSLPIEISDTSSITTTDAGLADSRVAIFHKAHDIFTAMDKTSDHEWSKLFLRYNGNDIRLMAPGKAMIEVPGQDNNPFKNNAFSQHYLTNQTKFGFDYLGSLWTYYKTHEIKIDVKELEGQRDDQGKTLPVACDNGAFTLNSYIFTGKVNGSDNFIFSNSDGCSVKLSNPQSISFFAGAVGTFDAPNNTPKAIIVREITSAFDVGLLPAPDNTVLGLSKDVESPVGSGNHMPNMNNYFIKNLHEGNYYKDNLLNATHGTGPWYDLYSEALHSYGHEHPIYTFAYDDTLGQDGTIHEGTGTNPGKVTVTLHDLTGTVIPDPLVEKFGFDVYITVPEALYIFKTTTSVPTTKAEFAGTDMLFDITNADLYQVKDGGVITAIAFPETLQQELKTIAAMPRNDDKSLTLFNGAMKEFLLKHKDILASVGLPLKIIEVTLENGPGGFDKLHDATTGANHIINATSPMKLKINDKEVSLYLDPYIVLPNDPTFDGILLQRPTNGTEHDVNITIPGNKPKNP